MPAASALVAGQLWAPVYRDAGALVADSGASFPSVLAPGLKLMHDVAGSRFATFASCIFEQRSTTTSRTSSVRARLWPLGVPNPEAEL